jgi:hypothetical protein
MRIGQRLLCCDHHSFLNTDMEGKFERLDRGGGWATGTGAAACRCAVSEELVEVAAVMDLLIHIKF